MATRKYNVRPKVTPVKNREGYLPDFSVESNFDYTSAYPCHVCHREFRSRHELATHPHPRKKVA